MSKGWGEGHHEVPADLVEVDGSLAGVAILFDTIGVGDFEEAAHECFIAGIDHEELNQSTARLMSFTRILIRKQHFTLIISLYKPYFRTYLSAVSVFIYVIYGFACADRTGWIVGYLMSYW